MLYEADRAVIRCFGKKDVSENVFIWQQSCMSVHGYSTLMTTPRRPIYQKIPEIPDFRPNARLA